MAMIGK